MVTAGIFLMIRTSPLLEYSSTALIVITCLGSLSAFVFASIGLVQNDLKRIIAYSTASQLGYLGAVCGLSQYNIAFYHIINHAFFVRQHRYLNLVFSMFNTLETHFKKWYDDPSFRNLLKKDLSTYLSFEFKLNLRWERLMKMNFCKNCIIVIENFYSFEKFIMEKINEGSQIMSRCRIEKISSPYFRIIIILMKIVQILKVGKPVNFYTNCINFLLFLPHLIMRIVILTIQSGCRISYLAKGLLNRNHRLYLTNSQECQISYSSYKEKNIIVKRIFKKECKDIFKPYKSINRILYELKSQIPKWVILLGVSNYNINFIRNYINKRSFIWAIKKHKGVSKKLIYSMYFESGKQNFSVLKTNKDILDCSKNNLNDNNLPSNEEIKDPLQEEGKKDLNNFFNLVNPDLKFINVEKEYENIISSLNKLDDSHKSGIYLFWLLDNPYKCYLGSAIDLKRRFKVHFKDTLVKDKHPKFYASVQKHGWSNFGFQIVNFHDISVLIEYEQLWLNKIFNTEIYAKNTLNILLNANNWLGHKHTEETKILMSEAKKGITLSEQHIKNISLGKLGEKHHYFGKNRSIETKLKISLTLKNNPSLMKPMTEEAKLKLSLKNSKGIVMLDKDLNIIKTFKNTTLAMKELNIGHLKLKSYLDKDLLYNDLYYLKSIKSSLGE